jgi:hypothetical protein
MSSFMVEFARFNMLKWAKENLRDFELKHLEPALDGDIERAGTLYVALDNQCRGIFAVDFWRCKMPIPAYQRFLSAVWDHDHRFAIAAAGNRRTLRAMFRYAAFPLPADIPEVVRVWRGTSYLSEKESAKGYSWTIDRDIACWFAMRFADRNNNPLVLAADVPKAEILLYHDERGEKEAVLFKPPAYWIDGHPEEWREGHKRESAKHKQHTQELFNSLPPTETKEEHDLSN